MEREKTIEEMACKIGRIFIEESQKEENKMYPWQELPVFRSICLRIATSILPDGAVVLKKEELVKATESGYVYDTTSGDKINIIEMAREIERKETAREILQTLWDEIARDGDDDYARRMIKNIAKENGVEVEE